MDLKRAQLEAALAAAHRRLFTAMNLADDMGDHGTTEDIRMLLAEVSRVAERSLDSRRKRTPSVRLSPRLYVSQEPRR